MKKTLKIILSVLVILVIVVIVYGWYQFRDRHQDYVLDLHLSSMTPAEIKAGFSKILCT